MSRGGKTVRIGAGAGYSGDRIDPAVELAAKGEIAYLVFECLAERTIALAQKTKRFDPHAGYDPCSKSGCRRCCPSARGTEFASSAIWGPRIRWLPPKRRARLRNGSACMDCALRP